MYRVTREMLIARLRRRVFAYFEYIDKVCEYKELDDPPER